MLGTAETGEEAQRAKWLQCMESGILPGWVMVREGFRRRYNQPEFQGPKEISQVKQGGKDVSEQHVQQHTGSDRLKWLHRSNKQDIIHFSGRQN